MYKIIFLSCVLLMLFVFGSNSNSKQVSAQKSIEMTGKVIGNVLDTNGAVIVLPKVQISFASSDFQKNATVDSEGNFEIILPVGVYQVNLKLNGFQPFTRSLIKVNSNNTYTLNLVLTPIYSTRGTSISDVEDVDVLHILKQYETLFADEKVFSGIKPIIQYETKCEVQNVTEYRNATLTYDFISIKADKISFRKADGFIESIGSKFSIENGTICSELKNIKFKLVGGEISVYTTCK